MELRAFLKLMRDKSASDLFVTAGVAPCLKIDGEVRPVGCDALSTEQARGVVYGLMNEAQRRQFEKDSECNFGISGAELGRFRVNVFMQQQRVGMVIRAIPPTIPDVEALMLPPALSRIVMEKRGLVLLVGATGSGKSSSLAAMTGYRNRNSRGHILTIEDPIEFVHEHGNCVVTQREVGVDTESYEVALKNAMRQAPDVILIGEIRTREAMDLAVQFAETGHLCLSTLHANNANQALDRILNFFPEDRRAQVLMDLSLNLRAIVSQRLIARKDGTGRVPAVEVMINSPLVADRVREGDIPGLKEVVARSREAGMQTFDQALFDLHEEGLISETDALRNADSANDLRLRLKLESKGARAQDLSGSLKNARLL